MNKSWVEECAERRSAPAFTGATSWPRAMENAIREALEKAAQIVDNAEDSSLDPYEPGIDGIKAAAAIRALGSK